LEKASDRSCALRESRDGRDAPLDLPHLREYVLKQHVVLYAHSSGRVVLFALRHHPQLSSMV